MWWKCDIRWLKMMTQASLSLPVPGGLILSENAQLDFFTQSSPALRYPKLHSRHFNTHPLPSHRQGRQTAIPQHLLLHPVSRKSRWISLYSCALACFVSLHPCLSLLLSLTASCIHRASPYKSYDYYRCHLNNVFCPPPRITNKYPCNLVLMCPCILISLLWLSFDKSY